jgi:hypothetical protein
LHDGLLEYHSEKIGDNIMGNHFLGLHPPLAVLSFEELAGLTLRFSCLGSSNKVTSCRPSCASGFEDEASAATLRCAMETCSVRSRTSLLFFPTTPIRPRDRQKSDPNTRSV